MAECKVAKQYWPERLLVLDALPRTPSGKMQKFRLREGGGRSPGLSGRPGAAAQLP
jgi:acyl-CoA synthetase (AMP-forming)/AMP-acid ligase II